MAHSFRHSPHHRRPQKGSTLVELMVGIVIGLLTVGVGIGALMVSRGVSSTVSDTTSSSSMLSDSTMPSSVIGRLISGSTTPASASILTGITRDSIIRLARDAGIEVVERDIPREYLYLCDELLMCGTAAEITPLRSVDGKPVGDGRPGPVTRRLQQLFFGLFDGTTPDTRGWLDYI